eukprot:SM000064S19781  [mRNA]  locus=s64:687676:689495:+ [translate_table: standard]
MAAPGRLARSLLWRGCCRLAAPLAEASPAAPPPLPARALRHTPSTALWRPQAGARAAAALPLREEPLRGWRSALHTAGFSTEGSAGSGDPKEGGAGASPHEQRPVEGAHTTPEVEQERSAEGVGEAEAEAGPQDGSAAAPPLSFVFMGRDISQQLTKEDLIVTLGEADALLKVKDEQLQKLKDTLMRLYEEMEDLRDRTKREMELTKKYAIQDFAKALLDVADNLSRAKETVPADQLKDGLPLEEEQKTVKLLKSLYLGVDMTEKQLLQVFLRFGISRFVPLGEPFDPHLHNALFEIDDPTKVPGTVAHVIKPGYTLGDRVLRAADVGIVRKHGS